MKHKEVNNKSYDVSEPTGSDSFLSVRGVPLCYVGTIITSIGSNIHVPRIPRVSVRATLIGRHRAGVRCSRELHSVRFCVWVTSIWYSWAQF